MHREHRHNMEYGAQGLGEANTPCDGCVMHTLPFCSFSPHCALCLDDGIQATG
ncbi:hypothetical protein KSZ_73880 [Dictyobacter formicarum]|uniref:Uncharacterized protein n=1 Tax=Dictyobacter formicarum TaxID=2778368 RepID=A0ABQ3VSX4_9CHLR|nr:hypothetical protein KSZ_73880 [Dictyobacter formicarum]